MKKIAQAFGTTLYTSEVVASDLLLLAYTNDFAIEWATSAYKDLLDTRRTADGFPPILTCSAEENWTAVEGFAKYGADLHYVGKDVGHSPMEETITSLSLYSSRRFFEWRDILRDLNVDIAGFIKDELQCN